jgi:hypothetical protein
MMTRSRWRKVAIIILAVVGGLVVRNQIKVHLRREASREATALAAAVRQQMFDALRPVGLSNCQLERFGEPNDGGYVLCANLLTGAKSGYSYGISGYDEWGCDVSARLNVPMHEYDCFNTMVPVCKRGRTIFHAECVGTGLKTEDGRLFDSIAGQFTKNGDATNHVVMKMDVEGAEWESLLAAPDEVLDRIDQLTIELHGTEHEQYLRVVQRLKRFFHVAHIHFNNHSCGSEFAPFPSWAYEVLFVNKKLDNEDPSKTPGLPLPIDAPNNPKVPDCQTAVR